MKRRSVAQPDYSSDRPGGFTRNSENSKANRIETMKGPAESGQICSVGRRKIAKKIAKNKRCYANTLRPFVVRVFVDCAMSSIRHAFCCAAVRPIHCGTCRGE